MYGQRGMPDDDATDSAPSPVARRSAESPPTPPEPPRHPGTPSRAALDDGPRRFRGSHLHERPRHADPDTAPEAPEDRRHWYVLTALGLVLALLVGAMYLLFGRSDTPGPGPVATTAPPASSPASAVAEPTPQTPSASGTASTDAPPSPTDPSSPTALCRLAACGVRGRSSTWRTRTTSTGTVGAGPLLPPGVASDGRSKAAPRNWVLPSWIGVIERGGPPNADDSASATTRYLPSLIEEIAYITTKKASSNVTRSP